MSNMLVNQEHRKNLVKQWHGFAARCEAVAVPRRLALEPFGLRPWFGLCPLGVKWRNPTSGKMVQSVNI
jgi:hypothetical protein